MDLITFLSSTNETRNSTCLEWKHSHFLLPYWIFTHCHGFFSYLVSPMPSLFSSYFAGYKFWISFPDYVMWNDRKRVKRRSTFVFTWWISHEFIGYWKMETQPCKWHPSPLVRQFLKKQMKKKNCFLNARYNRNLCSLMLGQLKAGNDGW